MNKHAFTFAAAVFLGLLALNVAAQEVCTQENPVLRPQFVLGDTWLFSNTASGYLSAPGHTEMKFETYENESSVHSLTMNDGIHRIYLSPDGNMVKDINPSGKNVFMGSEVPLFRFPLFAGKTWNGSYQFESRNASGQYTGIRTMKISVRVVGPETITIAGQAMATCKLQAESYIIGQDNPYNGHRTYWYSPQAKRVVKSEFVIENWGSVSFELESYTLGGTGQQITQK